MKVKKLTARLLSRWPSWSKMDDGEKYITALGVLLLALHPAGLIMGLTGHGWGVLYTAFGWDAVVVVCLGVTQLVIWRERRAIEKRRAMARATAQAWLASMDKEKS